MAIDSDILDKAVHKTFDFTIFWKSETELDAALETLAAWAGDCTRLQACKEVCPDTGREHLQCKVTWRRGKRWSAMKKLIEPHHFETSKSLCFAYCAKMGSKLVISVDSRAPGSRNELVAMKTMIDEGAKTEELWHQHFGSMARYHGAMAKYRSFIDKKRVRPKLVLEWIYGPSGSNKSTIAERENPDAYWLGVGCTGKLWWDGYDGEETVIVDDFRPAMCSYSELLKMTNSRGKYRIEHKGGSAWLSCKKIVFTSILHPESLFVCTEDEPWAQLHRRITRYRNQGEE